MSEINLEKNYSEKMQPLFELGYTNLRYKGNRFNYIEKFGFGQEDIAELIQLAIDRSDEALDYELYEAEIDRFYPATLHAVCALAELKAIEAVEPVLQRMYEDDINDGLHEIIPEFIGKMGEGVIDILREHILKNQENKIFLFEAIEEIIKRDPETKGELLEMLIDYIQFSDDGAEYLGYAISSLVNIDGTTHIEFIRDMFKTKDIDFSIMGDIEDIEIQLGLRQKRDTPVPGYWVKDEEPEIIVRPQQQVNAKPKVGRNDPCPCGSGRKYKKCCLNK